MFGVKFIVSGKIFFHVGKEDGDVDNVVPARARVLQHEPHVFEYGVALLFDVVTQYVARGVQRDAGNLLAAAHARPDSGEEKQVTNTLGVWKCADRFGCARAFEGLAHPCGGYFSNFGKLGSMWSQGCASDVHIS